LEGGTKAGYLFTYVQDASVTPSLHYTLNADPQNRGISGQRSFFSSDGNVTRFNTTGAASSTDSPLQ
jgi:hypothetical protein